MTFNPYLVRARRKMEELTAKRDRLNVRIAALDKYIANYLKEREASDKLWAEFRRLREERDDGRR